MKKQCVFLALVLMFCVNHISFAQSTPAQALTNVTLHSADGNTTESTTIVWRNGVIEAVGNNVEIPFDAFVIDGGDSLHVYPGFIDGLAKWGGPDLPKDLEEVDVPGSPPYDRAGIQPQRKPSELLQKNDDFVAGMKAGFTTAGLGLKGYMLPGAVEVFFLSPAHDEAGLYKENVGISGSFEEAPGGWGNGVYPSTLMGVMAKFRQLMFDATALQEHINYYRENSEMPAPKRDQVLEALFPLVNNTQPFYFEVDSKEDIERLFLLQDQFGFNAVIVSGKEAYSKAGELKSRNIPVLASFDFTDAPEWHAKSEKSEEDENDEESESDESSDEEEEELTEEEQAYRDKQLQAWKEEVTNIKKLKDAGVQVGYASAGFDLKDLNKKLTVLLDEGELTEAELLQLMTINTAQILGVDRVFGSISNGKNASFSVFDKPFSEDEAKVVRSVSNGTMYEF